jgi:hypothetical protein
MRLERAALAEPLREGSTDQPHRLTPKRLRISAAPSHNSFNSRARARERAVTLMVIQALTAGCGPCRTARSAARVENHSHDSGLTSVRTNSPKWRHHRRLQRGRGAPGEVLSCSISNPKLTRPAFASDCKSLCPAFVLALCPIRPAWPLVPNRAVDCRSCHPGTSGGIPFDLFHCPGGPSTSFRSRLPCLCRNRSPSRNLSFRWATRHSRKLQSDRNLPVCLRRSRWPAIVAIVE